MPTILGSSSVQEIDQLELFRPQSANPVTARFLSNSLACLPALRWSLRCAGEIRSCHETLRITIYRKQESFFEFCGIREDDICPPTSAGTPSTPRYLGTP